MPPIIQPINHLVDEVLGGNNEAFSELYNQTIHTVYRTLYFLSRHPEELNDIVQNVYVELYKNLAKFDRARSFQYWLTGIAVRQHQAYRRQRWRQQRNEAVEVRMTPAAEPDFADSLIDKVSHEHLVEQIAALSYKQKQVVILHYLNELTHEEIADILQIPPGTVKSRLHSALSRLRRQYRRESHV